MRKQTPLIAFAACIATLINRDTNCAGETTMQCRDAIKSARALVVLSSHRWTKMLVRRQAHAFEIIVGVACAGFSTTEFHGELTSVLPEKPGNPLDSQARAPNDSDTFETRWRAIGMTH